MKTATPVSMDEYLHSSYQPDREYIDGEIQERNLGEKDHSQMQGMLIAHLWPLRMRGLYTWPEQRVQVRPTRFRVPDICVTIGSPDEQIFTAPPYIVIEILSPDDAMTRLTERIDDYWEFGVRNIWIIDPRKRTGYRVSPSTIETVDVLRTEGEPEVTLEVARLFE